MVEFMEYTPTDDEYLGWVTKSNGEPVNHLRGVTILCIDDDEKIMFVTVTILSYGTVHIQYAGYIKDDVSDKIRYWKLFIKYVKSLGYLGITGNVYQKNRVALMWALRTGFNVNGCHQDTSGNLFIEIAKEL